MMKLNLIAPLNCMSYGYVGCFIYEELKKLIDVKIRCIRNFSAEERFHYIAQDASKFNYEFHHDAPSLKIWHQFDLNDFTGRGPKIGFPIFELDKFSDLEKHNLSYPDHLLVCSEWAKSIVLKEIDRKEETVHVVPLGVDRETFKHALSVDNAATKFVNYGKWEVRKGHDVLIEAFNRAFTQDDDVKLFMSCENVFLTQHQHDEWLRFYANNQLASKVEFIKRQEDQLGVYNTMKHMDCGVFPSRAEGWNLELLEMMSCGKHVIATNVTGHTEFCNSDNCMLIDLEDMETAFDGQFFNGQGDWYSIEDKHIDQLAEYMKNIHKLKQEGKLGQNEEGIKTAKEFTWVKSAERIVKVLEEIL